MSGTAPSRALRLACAAAALSGCIGIRGSSAPPPLDTPRSGEAPSVAVTVSGQSTVNGAAAETGPVFQVWQQAVVKAYGDSRMFSAVTIGLAPADLHADVRVTSARNVSQPLTIFNAATIAIIPNVTGARFAVETSFRNAAGATLATFTRSEDGTVVSQLLLLPLMPLLSPERMQNEIVYDLNRAIVQEAVAQGVLSAAGPGGDQRSSSRE